jgi:hypothetical protein
MRTAKDLMLDYLADTAEQSGALFADHGTLGLPYLASVGLPPTQKGPEEITKFLSFLHGTLYPGFSFSIARAAMESFLGILQKGRALKDYQYMVQSREAMFDHLAWWGEPLKAARERTKPV